MKIAFFTPSLKIGGVEKVFMHYAKKFSIEGHEVTYLTCHKGIELFSLNVNFQVQNIGGKRLRKSLIPLVKHLRVTDYDFLITGGDFPNFLMIFFSLLFSFKFKVVISQHNYFNVERNKYASKVMMKYFYNKAFKVIAVSEGIKSFLVENGVLESKIRTIYNPLDIEEIRALSFVETNFAISSPYLLFVGRLGEVKNLSLLLDAFRILKESNYRLKLVIVGDGPEKIKLEEYTQNYKLEEEILFTGVLSNPYPLIKDSSIVVLPSFSEALPTIVVESFVLGKTVVSTPTKGALDLMENGRLGYISDTFNDSQAFAKLLARAIAEPIDKDALLEKARNFHINDRYKELANIF